MNASLSKIALQLVTELEAVVTDPAAREEAHKEVRNFLTTCERLKALGVKFESEAQSVVDKVEGAVESVAQSVVNHAEGLLA